MSKNKLQKFGKLVQKEGPELPPIPTLPPQPDSFLPLVESLSPSLLKQLQSGFLDQVRSQTKLTGGGKGHIPGIPGKDYPDFKTIPHTEFSCENFILEGFYADTFTSCQVSFDNKIVFRDEARF